MLGAKPQGPVLEEQEIKLQVDPPEQFEAVMQAPELQSRVDGAAQRLVTEAHYFDTPRHHLLKAGYAYRIRQEGGRWKATVKRAACDPQSGLHHHLEWETELSEPIPDLTVFDDPQLGDTLEALRANQPLVPLFQVKVERSLHYLLLSEGTQVEWAADQGTIIAGEHSEPVCEIELELKVGRIQAVQQLAEQLCQRYPVQADPRTKFERGLRLAGLQSIPEAISSSGTT